MDNTHPLAELVKFAVRTDVLYSLTEVIENEETCEILKSKCEHLSSNIDSQIQSGKVSPVQMQGIEILHDEISELTSKHTTSKQSKSLDKLTNYLTENVVNDELAK